MARRDVKRGTSVREEARRTPGRIDPMGARPPAITSARSSCWRESCGAPLMKVRSPKSWSGRWSALGMWLRSWPRRGAATTRSFWPSSIPTQSTSTTRLTANSTLKRTPLYDRHVALGGRMVDFGGWEMPPQYTSIRDEHFAVRKAARLFDVSHMGRVRIEGAGAEAYLQRLLTNDVASGEPGPGGL